MRLLEFIRKIFRNDEGPSERRQLQAWSFVLTVSVLTGLFIVLVFAAGRGSTWKQALQLGANALILAGASLLVGGLLGFLFGIPRTDTQRPADDNGSRYAANTNLEQISDWLTKILVGVGLTQLSQIGETLTKVAEFFAPALAGDAQAKPFALCVIVFFTTAGFMFAYLWSRIYLARAMDLADISYEVQHELKEQATVDANALSLTEQQLAPQAGGVPVDLERLREAMIKASPGVKVRIFFQASKLRAETWRTNRKVMERTIPVFEALIASDPEKRFHKNFGQLGFALIEKDPPDPERGEAMLSEAIRIRGAWSPSVGWVYYEFCRAICRIRQDPNFKLGKPASPEVRAKIVEDLQVVERSGERVASELVAEWARLNELELECLRQDE